MNTESPDPDPHREMRRQFARLWSQTEKSVQAYVFSMVVIAPNNPAGLSAIEEKLTPENLSQWIGHLKKRDTHVYLPRFKMETKYTLGDADELGTLQRMGMVRAFVDPRDPKKGAQFYGMTTSTNPMEQLYISKVFHKAFIDVNEKGAEAAAAAAVVMAVPM